MKISKVYSPNFDKKSRSNKSIKLIVIHYTGMQSERESISRLRDPKSKVSSHFLISRNGKVFRLIEDKHIAWHAGVSYWGKYKNLNKNSIGIELVNKGHDLGYTNYKKKQISTLIRICKNLIKKYKIEKKHIVGHSDIAPLRKFDPGEKFPWKELANKKIGIWHNYKVNELIKFRKIKIYKKFKLQFINNLKKIGYCYKGNKKSDLIKIIMAFQRRYRIELIDGKIDKECLIIAQNLSKKL